MTLSDSSDHVVTQIRNLTGSTFVLRFSRGRIKFRSGQHIIVGLQGELDQREYSIYSSENDDHIEILIREVKDGNISSRLKQCRPGQKLDVNGPFGSFGIEPFNRDTKKHVFIATGTGISPFHSMIRSYSGMDYQIIHGVRFSDEAYERNDYEPGRYILCTSKEKYRGRQGRVTSALTEIEINPDMLFYLCGNGSMIHEVYNILRSRGIPARNIFSERYF